MCSICYLRLTVTRLSSQSLGKSMFPFSCCRSLMAVILGVSLSRPLSCPLHPDYPPPLHLRPPLFHDLLCSYLPNPASDTPMSPKSWNQSHAVLIPMGISPPAPPPPPKKKKEEEEEEELFGLFAADPNHLRSPHTRQPTRCLFCIVRDTVCPTMSSVSLMVLVVI